MHQPVEMIPPPTKPDDSEFRVWAITNSGNILSNLNGDINKLMPLAREFYNFVTCNDHVIDGPEDMDLSGVVSFQGGPLIEEEVTEENVQEILDKMFKEVTLPNPPYYEPIEED